MPEFPVCRGKRKLLDLPMGHPLNRRMFQSPGLRRVYRQAAPEPLQAKREIRVDVHHRRESRLLKELDQAPKFVLDLSSKGICRLFSFFHFPTRELPPSGQMFSFRSLAEKNTLLPKDQRTDDIKHGVWPGYFPGRITIIPSGPNCSC